MKIIMLTSLSVVALGGCALKRDAASDPNAVAATVNQDEQSSTQRPEIYCSGNSDISANVEAGSDGSYSAYVQYATDDSGSAKYAVGFKMKCVFGAKDKLLVSCDSETPAETGRIAWFGIKRRIETYVDGSGVERRSEWLTPVYRTGAETPAQNQEGPMFYAHDCYVQG